MPTPDIITLEQLPFYQPLGNEVAVFEHAWHNQLPLLLKGPTGCGKTRFIEHMAARLRRPLYTIACHDDLTAADLIGRHLIGDGDMVWHDGPLTRAVREGAICYLDEVVEARKDTTVVLHPLSDDRRMLPIERTGELLQAPPEFMLVMSYNPGYQNLMKGLKPSTRQRFLSLSFGYPEPALEKAIVEQETGLDGPRAQQLVELAQALRALEGYDLEEGVSTRLLVYCAILMQSGLSTLEAARVAIVEPLTDDSETIGALNTITEACLAG